QIMVHEYVQGFFSLPCCLSPSLHFHSFRPHFLPVHQSLHPYCSPLPFLSLSLSLSLSRVLSCPPASSFPPSVSLLSFFFPPAHFLSPPPSPLSSSLLSCHLSLLFPVSRVTPHTLLHLSPVILLSSLLSPLALFPSLSLSLPPTGLLHPPRCS